MPEARASESIGGSGVQHVDIAVVGAGFAGLYLLHRLRQAGFAAQGLEAADDVGGTWYWNRYPGARCDIQTTDYSFTFDPELEAAWQWSEKYATQPEILRYLGFVADRYDLRRDIRFATRVTSAHWNEATQRWLLATSAGPSVFQRLCQKRRNKRAKTGVEWRPIVDIGALEREAHPAVQELMVRRDRRANDTRRTAS